MVIITTKTSLLPKGKGVVFVAKLLVMKPRYLTVQNGEHYFFNFFDFSTGLEGLRLIARMV